MTKIGMLADMLNIIEEMKTIFPDITVKENHLNFESKKCIILPMTFIRPAYKWLCNIRYNEYYHYTKCKNLVPDNVWKQYALFPDEFKYHAEVILVRKSLVNLRKAIVNIQRPDFFKRGKRNGCIKKTEKKRQHK